MSIKYDNVKILWFTNTPCGASKKFNINLNIGGWLTSLEEELIQIDGIKLCISFYWGEKVDPFVYKKTTYYPVLREREGTKVGRLVNRAFQINDDSREVKRLLTIIELVKPDIIHVHGTESNFGLIQDFTDIPVVISMQGILSAYLEKYYAGIPSLAAIQNEGFVPKLLFKSVGNAFKNLRNAAVRERKILSQAKYVIGRTDWDMRISQLLAPKSRYFTGNEILRKAFYENRWKKKDFATTLQLVTVMSGGVYKGFETIVKTAALLHQVNTIDFSWTVIGQHEQDDMIKIFKRWLKIDFKLLNIRLIGSKSEVEVADVLLKSDVYCQVSHIENSPNSLCEAMLLGMPVIASFAGGTDSLLENRKQGLLIQDGDPYSLAGTIIEMARGFSMASAYGSEANKRAEVRHDKNTITLKLNETYCNILGLHR